MSDPAQQNPAETASATSPAAEKTESQRPAGRLSMPQDVRYCTEQDDRVKLAEKYEQYKVSDVDACHVRFLTDNRQKRNLFGQNEEERTGVQALSKTCRVNIFPGYQQATKHSYKIFGAEADVRKCLVEVMKRVFKRPNRSKRDAQPETELSTGKDADDHTPYATPSALGEAENQETPSTTGDETKPAAETKATGDEESAAPTASTADEEKPVLQSTPASIDEQTDSNIELKSIPSTKEPTKYVPSERKPQWTFTMLISSQGQEVLKKNWSFFAGSLQQRLDVVVMNPVKLSKFGDKQIQNELPITGESIENITDAILQITAFINDVLGIPTQPFNFDEEAANADQYQTPDSQPNRTPLNRSRSGAFEQTILVRSDCVPRVVGTRASNLKRIQNKCRLREIIVARQANENGYVECTLSAFQIRNIHFAINTIRNSLRNEGESAVLVHEPNHGDDFPPNSPRVHELVPPNTEQTPTESGHSSEEIGFLPNTLQFHNNKSYPQPSYNFQNTPSFDFTHQATSAARKTDKRRGELHDNGRTPSEAHSSHYESLGLNSPRQKTKRACPETKEIDCTTDEGFWIQKQYYYALDDASKQLFDSLIEKVEKIRIASEENASRKQQRLVGRNKCNKSKVHSSTVSYLTEGNQLHQKEPITKATPFDNKDNADPSIDEKENKQETSTAVVVNQD